MTRILTVDDSRAVRTIIGKTLRANFDILEAEDGEKGLRVIYVEPESKAAGAGIQEGDLLIELNRLRLKSRKDIPRALGRRTDSKQNHLLRYLRDGKDIIGVIKQE